MEDASKRKRELEAAMLDKVGEVISAIRNAKRVDQVICALHSLAVLLFPLDYSSLLAGSIDQAYRDQVLSAKVPSEEERKELWQVFYRGAAYPTLARVLLLDLASNWLACFPLSARIYVYDVFFVNGLATEVVQTLVPCLQQNARDNQDVKYVNSNTERLLVLCLLENDGMLQLAREFCTFKDSISECFKSVVSRIAQLIASVPDKARLGAPVSLSSHFFFKQITIQLLSLAEERDDNLLDKEKLSNKSDTGGALLFVGEIFSRICRRGSADVLLSEITPRVLGHVRSILSSNDSVVADVLESHMGSQFWLKMIEVIKDSYAVERISELLLHRLAAEHATDVEAYWILWLLFYQTFKHQTSMRSMFVDKFLLWKTFPICCLRWILQFAVLECPPDGNSLTKGQNNRGLLDILQRLLAVWCKREFVQSASMEQQTYVSAAIGLSLEKMSRGELDETRDLMQLILEGVSCRLESPNDLVRKMASNVALVFSKVIDPKNPLYLDDSCSVDIIDWEFGLATLEKGNLDTTNCKGQESDKSKTSSLLPERDSNNEASNRISKNLKSKNKELSEFKFVDPDEIIDPATLNNEPVSDNDGDDDNASENSDSLSDSSLQPYDLADDDTDLKKKISQLVDVVGALRKPDDADGVERALDVAEKLVRASPDELRHVASDLARTLIQVRCSDLAVEGEEESVEDKRQRALIAVVVTCPVESLDTLNKLLYSPNVDISQRILILDVMTEAAQELANTRTMKPKRQTGPLIASISESHPWFLPSSIGPPGAGSWKEISEAGTLLNWSSRYERELPSKQGQIMKGKTRRWSLGSSNRQENQMDWSNNKFPVYAAAFMLPAMQGFDKRSHGVDLLGRDFVVLGKLIYMLGVCMKCAAMHPEASALAPHLLDMLKSREMCYHKEGYVRRAVLFAASCILVALHPSYVASSLVEGNLEVYKGLEWIRTWANDVAESDTDRECYMMAMTCLKLYSEMALQASRAMESAETTLKTKSIGLPSNLSKGTIKIPPSIMEF